MIEGVATDHLTSCDHNVSLKKGIHHSKIYEIVEKLNLALL